jgi:serpin B
MLTRRQTLQALGAVGLAAPALTACGSGSASQTSPGDPDPGVRLVSADVPLSAGDASALPGVVSSMGAFTVDLWGAIGDPTANLALSPYSIAVALAMTANGARGTTARQMEDVLHIGSLSTYNAGIAALTQQITGLSGPVKVLDKTEQVELSTANQLFGDEAVQWQKAFLTVLAKQYGAGMRTVDFQRQAEAARVLVNSWTAQQTHDRITDILPKGTVDALTRLVLVDAIYFKAPWELPFEKAATKQGAFTRPDGTKVTVPMMASEAAASYLSGTHFQGARLSYAGEKLAMTLALPEPGGEAAALRELLDSGLTRRTQPELHLTMPRWTYRIATDLKAPLMQLGMADAFGPGADFSGMTDDDQLSISAVLHQTYVAVDEDGTEAAAATAVAMGDSAVLAPPQQLVLDRSFLYVVHDTAHGTPLFVGRVADPSSA